MKVVIRKIKEKLEVLFEKKYFHSMKGQIIEGESEQCGLYCQKNASPGISKDSQIK